MNEHHLTSKKYNKTLSDNDERTLSKSYNHQKTERSRRTSTNLFDITSKNAFEKMNVQENIDFYRSQEKPGRSGSASRQQLLHAAELFVQQKLSSESNSHVSPSCKNVKMVTTSKALTENLPPAKSSGEFTDSKRL